MNVVGYWVMPDGAGRWRTKVKAYNKPSWLYRTVVRVFLGWQWEENT